MMTTLREPQPTPDPGEHVREVPGPRTCLGLDLRELAEDLAGRVDRDELSSAEAADFADVLDGVVITVLPQVADLIAAELGSRLESLPLHARLALANARLRLETGAE